MPPHTDLLQAGIEAIQQKHFSDAIQRLEAFCRQTNPNSKDYFQAQMWLVRAYQEHGQAAQAIALCQQMATSSIPQVREWAERILPRLTTPPPEAPPAATTDRPSYEPLSAGASREFFQQGNKALKAQRFAEAVAALEAYCHGTAPGDSDYAQAQMWLVKAYKGNEQTQAAINLCQQLLSHEKEYVQTWAKQYLQTLAPEAVFQTTTEDTAESSEALAANGSITDQSAQPRSVPKAGRSNRRGVKLTMRGVAASLALASGLTLSLLGGMILVLAISLLLIVGKENPTEGLVIGVAITIVFNLLVFFLSPLIMDLVQGWLYGTRWTTLSEIQRYSPEAAKVIREVCQQKKLQEPRLGIIEDQNPTAFTYGSLPNSARLVVSKGIFTYLDDDEIATVYAHELGHIVHWDFAVMTLAATLVQITYLLYVYAREMANHLGDSEMANKVKNGAQMASLMAYVFYIVGEYLLLYLSRTREYYADHFAAEVTGNPNGLSRSLVKIAYGILEEGKRSNEPSKVLQGTRALGIADPKSATLTGTAYRVAAEPQKMGRVFLWDMFNPWAWWMELNSTHPLTGKRVRALSTYAEQLGLDTEFDMGRVIREGRSLNKQKLYGNFAMDVVILWADVIGLVLGLAISIAIFSSTQNWRPLVSLPLICFGFGTLLKMVFMYPDFSRAPETDILTLMSDPYASPLRGRAVKLAGEVIGRGDSGYKFSSDLKLQDPTGMIYLHYSSRWGPLGNFLFGMTQADGFVNQQVRVTGWFRRGIMPWIDFTVMECDRKWTVHSYHRFWTVVLGLGAIVLGFLLPRLL
ncbi:M48 family metalloprotease [Pantanalinema sp. GBBB05]|uniref:M48 family metalloprotease n=1 Tax=Pantanalinema sp. GBBB05 TaxID=2604139 RepID=UPI003D818749